jgi:hypothetical protein
VICSLPIREDVPGTTRSRPDRGEAPRKIVRSGRCFGHGRDRIRVVPVGAVLRTLGLALLGMVSPVGRRPERDRSGVLPSIGVWARLGEKRWLAAALQRGPGVVRSRGFRISARIEVVLLGSRGPQGLIGLRGPLTGDGTPTCQPEANRAAWLGDRGPVFPPESRSFCPGRADRGGWPDREGHRRAPRVPAPTRSQSPVATWDVTGADPIPTGASFPVRSKFSATNPRKSVAWGNHHRAPCPIQRDPTADAMLAGPRRRWRTARVAMPTCHGRAPSPGWGRPFRERDRDHAGVGRHERRVAYLVARGA